MFYDVQQEQQIPLSTMTTTVKVVAAEAAEAWATGETVVKEQQRNPVTVADHFTIHYYSSAGAYAQRAMRWPVDTDIHTMHDTMHSIARRASMVCSEGANTIQPTHYSRHRATMT